MSVRSDWTTGVPSLVITRCRACGETWYLPRARCRACRGSDLQDVEASGAGVAVAVTHGGVVDDPDGEGGGLALVDLEEGVRAMTRCAPDVVPGSVVRVAVAASADGSFHPRAALIRDER